MATASTASAPGAGHLRAVADLPLAQGHAAAPAVGETANLSVRTSDTVRFIASIESDQAPRSARVRAWCFPPTAPHGQFILAGLDEEELEELYAPESYQACPGERPNLRDLRAQLSRVRRSGFGVNHEYSESGLTAVGVLGALSVLAAFGSLGCRVSPATATR